MYKIKQRYNWRYAYKTVGTPKSWSLIKNEIEDYSNNLWTKGWHEEKRFKHTKEFFGNPDANIVKGVMNTSSLTTITWIKAITGHKNLSYFQSKINPEIFLTVDYAKSLSKQHIILRPICERMASYQRKIMENKIPLSDLVHQTNIMLHTITTNRITYELPIGTHN